MSHLRSGGLRIRKAGAVFAALLVFQVLAIVGAGSASAAVVCNYDASSGTVEVRYDLATLDLQVYVTDAADAAGGGQIRVWDDTNGATVDCGSATTGNTNLVTVLGANSPAVDNDIEIENRDADGGNISGIPQGFPTACCAPFPNGINFAVDLGEHAFDDDEFYIEGRDNSDTLTLNSNSTFTRMDGTWNGGTIVVTGVDTGPGIDPGIEIDTNDGDDTYDGNGSFTRLELDMDDGNDTAMPGLGPEEIDGDGDRGDHVIYDRGTTPVSVSLNSLADDNDDGSNCVDDTTFFGSVFVAGCEGDDIWGFQIVETGAGNDILRGDLDDDEELFAPGPGNDHVNGEGQDDVMSYFNCDGPITIDSALATSTGGTCGTDTWENTEFTSGTEASSSFNPTDGSVTGGDTLTFAGETGPIEVDLENGDIEGSSSLEDVCTHENDPVSGGDPAFWGETLCEHVDNVIGSPGHDNIDGNEDRNVLDGGEGDDEFFGDNGNDVLIGRGGNDDFNGGSGADAVWFGAAPNGVIVDLSLNFATGEGDDSFSTSGTGFDDITIEIVFGSQFGDDITGGLTGFGSGTNFRMIGKDGGDNLTGADSNDTLLGGRGDDVMRGGSGLDTLKGAQGEDWGFGGGGRDFCARSTEHRRSC